VAALGVACDSNCRACCLFSVSLILSVPNALLSVSCPASLPALRIFLSALCCHKRTKILSIPADHT
jgi:hypothetical protein